ncbi:uncharacterized protein LOC117324085 [Pecten maximus]|uniref:uncharacterized protein LOC117324085 n=1 Tax=Pecten maximus TaxID=6579 RepID=UPI001458E0C0|nr:uncharacterized protein LOC117324085 [Pecten maximus]XP_033735619.1 uncharacterized protein LOC117324085 [Pecten maximus]XP_033735629.1 uncharacterized protein LOC117324085 [Pecten maximus]XP_033735639.1 uncharacterized protein LOC117324085 [Pecten maximus]XP_033735648.1 uncharacterized protein LOC117324085 [Pecten maximus]XP_033735656.1 uncharacterized protein LOC117324085 [Pecten maximus]XP_033735664.1 uncharacterized protein LOC117324085 [Pecten maximus]
MSQENRPVVYPPKLESKTSKGESSHSSNQVSGAYLRPSSNSQSHSGARRNSGNYPDIVDSDNCFLPSESFTDLRNTMESSNNATNTTDNRPSTSGDTTGQGTRAVPQSPGVVSEHRRSISAIIDHQMQQALEESGHNTQRVSPTQGLYPAITNSSATTGVMGSTHISTHDLSAGITPGADSSREALPDILHSHVIPTHHTSSSHHGQSHGHLPPGVDPRVYTYHQSQARHHSRHHRGGRSSRDRRRSRSRSGSQTEEPCKTSCMNCLAASTSFRWILVILSLLGVCCVVTGIVLAALHAAGNSFLFLAIMFIGLGVLLVVVVAVGWKCTPRGHEPLHALFGLGDFRHQPRERRHRHHGHHRRRGEGQWYGGVMYPEFQYRRPPPSYNVSMQEFQHQLVMAQNQPRNFDDVPVEDYSLPSSPPPSYRSRASTVRTGIQITFPPSRADQPNSRPPTYRSHVGPDQNAHSRPSLPRDDDGNVVTGGDIQIEVPNISAINIISTSTPSNTAAGTEGPSQQAQGSSTSANPTVNTTGASGQTIVTVTHTTAEQAQVQRTLGTKNTDPSPGEQPSVSPAEDEYPMETPL